MVVLAASSAQPTLGSRRAAPTRSNSSDLEHPTVDILNAMDSARSLVYHAATVVGDGSLDQDAETACRMAKVRAGDALLFAGDRAVQFHGAMGFTHDRDGLGWFDAGGLQETVRASSLMPLKSPATTAAPRVELVKQLDARDRTTCRCQCRCRGISRIRSD
ncbi:MAG: acyl-CoA dehydrogenase family protein [Gammaproteobacteria bacterium]|nr:acyl-CoA dehydrogenase family protein [Gammaproteobacteria bacterium]